MGKEFESAVGEQRTNLLREQARYLEQLHRAGEIDQSMYVAFKQANERLMRAVKMRTSQRLSLRRIAMRLRRGLRDRVLRTGKASRPEVSQEILDVRGKFARFNLNYLQGLTPETEASRHATDFLIMENQRTLTLLGNMQAGQGTTMTLAAEQNMLEVEALRLELGCIQELREQGAITTAEASKLRDEVYLLQMNLSDYGAQ